MKAMILAAGKGERMLPLTKNTPKPLLHVGGKALIEWHIEKLSHAGFEEIIINVAHLAQKIIDTIGDGSRWDIPISYSDERESGGLETAGGIAQALPLLGKDTFFVVNADIFTNYPFSPSFTLEQNMAHLILVPNPPHNPHGDFGLKNAFAYNNAKNLYTFSGMAYYNPAMFANLPTPQKYPLAPLLRQEIDKHRVTAELFEGVWQDIGTPQRLKEINENIRPIAS